MQPHAQTGHSIASFDALVIIFNEPLILTLITTMYAAKKISADQKDLIHDVAFN